jgi:hypothetical protein
VAIVQHSVGNDTGNITCCARVRIFVYGWQTPPYRWGTGGIGSTLYLGLLHVRLSALGQFLAFTKGQHVMAPMWPPR